MVFVIVHTPGPISKGLDHSHFACLWFMLVLASLVLGLSMFVDLHKLDLMWLHSTPMRPCSDVMHRHDAGFFGHTFPLFHFVQWYTYHACLCHPLVFCASLHACLHIHAWVLLASVLSMLQHNEVMDIRSKPTFTPHRHHLLSAFCLFACFLASLLVMPIMLVRFMLFHMLFTSFPSIACLLVSCICLCMYTHGARMHGVRA